MVVGRLGEGVDLAGMGDESVWDGGLELLVKLFRGKVADLKGRRALGGAMGRGFSGGKVGLTIGVDSGFVMSLAGIGEDFGVGFAMGLAGIGEDLGVGLAAIGFGGLIAIGIGFEIGLTGVEIGVGIGLSLMGGGDGGTGSTSTGSTRVISIGSSISADGCHQYVIPAINPRWRITEPPKPRARTVFKF